MTAYYFVSPTDSLFVRGNLAFGDPGEHGTGAMPPLPSLFAGAFRSAILGRDPQAMARFAQDGRADGEAIDQSIGWRDPDSGDVVKQGSFRVAWLSLARTEPPTSTSSPPLVEAILPLPADLLCMNSRFVQLTPGEATTDDAIVADGRVLPRVAVARHARQEKPQGGVYLCQSGWNKYMAGKDFDFDNDSLSGEAMHASDPRLGIGIDAGSCTAETGRIYSTEGYAFSPPVPFTSAMDADGGCGHSGETGFLVGIAGAEGLLPESGFLRLGGDGRGAHYRRVNWHAAEPPFDTINQTGCFRLILSTPGLFALPAANTRSIAGQLPGWLPARVGREGGDYVLRAAGCTAHLVCAAVPHREVVSGWDLFQWRPKDALRAVPAGSVYWFEGLEGDSRKLADWVKGGLWGDNAAHDRRAEGYNLASLAAWI